MASEEVDTDEYEEVEDFWGTVRRWIAGWIVVTLVFWAVAGGYMAYSAQKHARNGERALRTAADVMETDDLADVDFGEVEASLVAGESELKEARSSIDSLVLRAMGPIPVVGRHLASARALIHTSHDVAMALTPVVSSARQAQDDPNGLDRVAFLAATSQQLAVLESTVSNADLGPEQNLVGPLSDGRAELEEQLADMALKASEYRVITLGLGSFLAGSEYVLLGANNAEMMLASGMHLSVGQLTVSDGEFELPGLTPSAAFFPVEAASAVDEDVTGRWGSLKPENDFRKLSYSARFDEFTGPQAIETWRAATGREVDGAIAVDPFVLDALLDVLGGVEVDGIAYSSGQALAYLLQDQYAEFDKSETQERRDRLSELATAVVEKFGDTSWDPVELISALKPLARGRHILVYSTDPVEQRAWDQLGVSGTLTGNETGVFLLNLGGAKLDPFFDMSVDAEIVEEPGGGYEVTYEIRIRNRAPASGLPQYTTGPWESLGLPSAGTYVGQVAVYAPGFIVEAGFVDGHDQVVFGPDGRVLVVATASFELSPGDEERLRFRYRLPPNAPPLRLVPSARFPSVNWTWADEAFNDSVARSLEVE